MISVHQMKGATDGNRPVWLIRVGAILGVGGLALLSLAMIGRIDSPEEMTVTLMAAFFLPIPLSILGFALTYSASHRWGMISRVVISLFVGGILWVSGCKIATYHAHYTDRARESLREKGWTLIY